VIDTVVELIREHPQAAALLPDPVHPLLVRGGPSGSRVSLLLFAASNGPPVLHLKLGHGAATRLRLRHEYAQLSAVAALPRVAATVPRPVAVVESGDTTVLVQTAVRGAPLAVLMRRRVRSSAWAGRDLRAALRWLARLQASTRAGVRPAVDPAGLHGRLTQVLPGGSFQRFRDQLAEAADRHGSLALPVVRRHGDFWPGNLLRDRDSITVVDWEHSDAEASPMDDLFFFLTAYGYALPGRRWAQCSRVEAFQAAWLGEGALASACTKAALSFAAEVGVPDTAVRVLLVQFLLDMIERPVCGQDHEWWQMLAGYAAGDARSQLQRTQERGWARYEC